MALLFLGCCPQPAPVAPTAASPVPQTAPAGEGTATAPSAPVEPVCTSTLAACKSSDTTRLQIRDSAATFHPPVGWNYAREAEQSVAFSPDRNAMLAFTTAESRSNAAVLQASKKLAERLHIKNIKYAWLSPRLKKTQLELEAGPHAVELWEVNESSQFGAAPKLEDELRGTFLLVVITVEGQGVFVGTAFVTKPDGDEHAAAVMESLQTFRAENDKNADEKPQGEP